MHEFEQVPIGLLAHEVPVQTLRIYNTCPGDLEYRVNTKALQLHQQENYGFRVFEIIDETGVVPADSFSLIRWRFHPLEARSYSVEVQIFPNGDALAKPQTLTLTGSGYHPNQRPFCTAIGIKSMTTRPRQRPAEIQAQFVRFVPHWVSFDTVPVLSVVHSLCVVENTCTSPLKFELVPDEASPGCKDLFIEPSSGVLAPRQRVLLRLTLMAGETPRFVRRSIVANISVIPPKPVHEARKLIGNYYNFVHLYTFNSQCAQSCLCLGDDAHPSTPSQTVRRAFVSPIDRWSQRPSQLSIGDPDRLLPHLGPDPQESSVVSATTACSRMRFQPNPTMLRAFNGARVHDVMPDIRESIQVFIDVDADVVPPRLWIKEGHESREFVCPPLEGFGFETGPVQTTDGEEDVGRGAVQTALLAGIDGAMRSPIVQSSLESKHMAPVPYFIHLPRGPMPKSNVLENLLADVDDKMKRHNFKIEKPGEQMTQNDPDVSGDSFAKVKGSALFQQLAADIIDETFFNIVGEIVEGEFNPNQTPREIVTEGLQFQSRKPSIV